MTAGWTFGGAPPTTAGQQGLVTLLEGATFCISESSGDVRPGAAQGLFFRDTRFVSRLELEIDGQSPEGLSAQIGDPYECTFIARRPPAAGLADSTLLVVRNRYVGNGMREDVILRNLGREPAAVSLTVAIEADFADLFEVKEGRGHPRGEVETTVHSDVLEISYQKGQDSRGLSVAGSGSPSVTSQVLTWQVVVPARGSWSTCLEVTPSIDGKAVPARYRCGEPVERATPAVQLADWRRHTPDVTTPDKELAAVFEAGGEALGALRIFDPEYPDRAVIAAGAPWFMTLFGRDSLLTSWMLLPLDQSLALGTLQTLARFQGEKVEPLTEEQPGRILHEMRFGLGASLSLGGGNVYYGTADATPLFVMLLGELRRWGFAKEAVDDLLPHADSALEWIEHYGDRDGDGFVEYQRATDRGLVNQGWKDSFDGITFASGRIAEPPVALAEVQGYVYAAYLARAHYAREVGDDHVARKWARKAAELKDAFNEKFWLEDRGYYAVGLDADKEPIDSLASNMGHCLWTGIVDEDRAGLVAKHLLGADLFSGFGIRTLATSMISYNPMSYHNGSIWPHDNAICAAGLMRYGFVDEAQEVATGILAAAKYFGGQLPELFCGFDRADFPTPVPYPTSCSPQAWAAATPFYLLRTLLRFDPWIPFGKLWCAPAVPSGMLPLRVDGLGVGSASVVVDVAETGWSIGGLPADIELVRDARRPLTAAVPVAESGDDQSLD